MSKTKVSLEVLVDNLLNEASQPLVDSPGLQSETSHFLKVYDLVAQIKLKESARDSSDLVTDPAVDELRRQALFPAFIRWLNDLEVDTTKIDIQKIENAGFGLRTTVGLKDQELAFAVPEKACITTVKAKESKLGILAEKDPLLRSMNNILLAVFLIYENYTNGGTSFWKPYIDILPKTYDTTLYFTKEEMMLLRCSPHVFRETVRMYCNIARQYAYFHYVFRKRTESASRALKSVFTFNRYVWAVSAVVTRQNQVPMMTGEQVLSLVPLWDLCNHSETGVISTDYNPELKQFTCHACGDYAIGEEFKIYYGRRTSEDYFIHGGFVPCNYYDSCYILELGLGNCDPNFTRKKELLRRAGLKCQSKFCVRPEDLMSGAVFGFVNVFLADAATMEKLESSIEDWNLFAETLNQPTEKTLTFLATRFRILAKANENLLAGLLKTVFGSSTVNEKQISSRIQMILQLMKNDQKVLESLVFRCNDLVSQNRKTEVNGSAGDQVANGLEAVSLAN